MLACLLAWMRARRYRERMTNAMTELWHSVDQMQGDPLGGFELAQLGRLRRELQAALAEVEAAARPKLVEHAAAGVSLQRMAELAGMSIQTVRKVVVPGAAEKNREWQARTRVAGREALGEKPSRGPDTGPRVLRADRAAIAGCTCGVRSRSLYQHEPTCDAQR